MRAFTLYLGASAVLLCCAFYAQPPSAKGWFILAALMAVTVGMYVRVIGRRYK